MFIDIILAFKPVPLLSNDINNNILDIIREISQKTSISIQKIINLIFVDESHFRLKQPIFKTWIKKEDFSPIGCKINKKINFLLAVSSNKF